MSLFMNEYEIDFAVLRYRSHPTLAKATRLLAAYRDEVNRKSDGWPYWGHKAAAKLMALIQTGAATEADVRRAASPIKAFCTRRGLAFPTV